MAPPAEELLQSARTAAPTLLVALLATAIVSCSSPVEIAQGSQARPSLVDASRRYTQVVAGFVHTCGLADGVAFCWGSNEYGQLGAEATDACDGRACSKVPLQVNGDVRFVKIAAGWVHNCGIAADGRAWCWGGGAIDGQGYLGDGRLSRPTTPVEVLADSALTSISLGDAHSCALTASGMAFCWGQNTRGQVGDGTRSDRSTPVPVATSQRFRSISAGANHTCGITTSNELLCWGANSWGELGTGLAGSDAPRPGPVSGGGAFGSVAAGWQHTCAASLDGEAFCWGRNDNASQLGDDSQVPGRDVPGPVSGGLRYSALYAGALATCGRTASNDVLCWGGNYYGGLGNGNTDQRGVGHPVRADGGPFASVSIGQSHACALAMDRRLWCWGDRSLGQF